MKKNAKVRIKETLGLIGVGNMGTAILEGLFRKGMVSPGRVWVCDKMAAKVKAFCKRWKTRFASSNQELIRHARVVLLAFKPQDLAALAEESKAFGSKQILISILAGTPIEKIERIAGSEVKIVRAMPNLGAKVGESVTAVAGSDARALRLAEKIFSGCGQTVCLPEDTFDTVTAVSGSGPAYFFLLMELLAKEAVERGIDGKQADILAVQTAVAAAQLAKTASLKPEDLRRMVTSRGGTTEAALRVLEKANFVQTFHDAIHAAALRGRELSQGSF